MKDIELVCFQMISALGQARSSYMEALVAIQKGEFEQAELLIKEGTEYRVKGHDVHFELLQQEAQGGVEKVPLLLIHAEDQLMTAEMLEVFAQQLLETHVKMNKLVGKEEI